MPANECAHLIPLLTDELVALCCRDPRLPEHERESLRCLAVAIGDLHHVRHRWRQVRLTTAYAPFDPDGDLSCVMPMTAEERQQRLNNVMSELTWLLDRAHYQHLSHDVFEAFLAASSDWGIRMRVDFSIFSHIAVFVRDEAYEERILCNWRTWFTERPVEVPVYRRLVLVFKLRPGLRMAPSIRSDRVYLKLFKNIPCADVDMLLPAARVKLKLLDRGKLGVGVLSSLGTMGYRVLHQLNDVLEMGLTFWGLTAGLLGYGYKSYFDYKTTHQSYHLNLTQSLYFQNLDSNVGVLTRLFDEAEEQETRTALLAYFCLLHHGHAEGTSAEDLEGAMGLYMDRYAGIPLVCEPGVAVDLLIRLGLVHYPHGEADGRVQAVPLSAALAAVEAARSRSPGPFAKRGRGSEIFGGGLTKNSQGSTL